MCLDIHIVHIHLEVCKAPQDVVHCGGRHNLLLIHIQTLASMRTQKILVLRICVASFVAQSDAYLQPLASLVQYEGTDCPQAVPL